MRQVKRCLTKPDYDMKPNSFVFLLMGIATSAYGVRIIFQKEYESWRYGYIDFGEYHQLIGLAVLLLGVSAIASVFRIK